ncbi:small ribosomal subunit protein mS40-like isoform X2 [Mytilus edulis]|uniref:small ribosomal subunit protein mS40-like isoform X2 n=1 Tax=Mytilus edulis TaxID=6550 RepID=UPI0039EECA40
MDKLFRLKQISKFCRSFVYSAHCSENVVQSRNLSITGRLCFIRRGEKVFEEEDNTVIAHEKRPYIQESWDTSIRYLESDSYKKTYGDDVVWKHYRRNFKGNMAPETREKCIRQGKIGLASPCPLCRDEYLTVDYRNIKLLRQFLNPFTGDVLPSLKTGVCQQRLKELQIQRLKAIDYGFIQMPLKQRHYDYSEYHNLAKESEEKSKLLSNSTSTDMDTLEDAMASPVDISSSVESNMAASEDSEDRNNEQKKLADDEDQSDSSSDSSDSGSESDSDSSSDSDKSEDSGPPNDTKDKSEDQPS